MPGLEFHVFQGKLIGGTNQMVRINFWLFWWIFLIQNDPTPNYVASKDWQLPGIVLG